MKFIICYNQECIIHNVQFPIEDTHLNYRIIHQRPSRSNYHIIYLMEIAFLVGISFFESILFPLTIKVYVEFCLDTRIEMRIIPILAAIASYQFYSIISF